MAARSPDPFAALSRRDRIALRWRLRRSWRAGVAERNLAILGQIEASVLGTTPRRVEWHPPAAEVGFDDGTVLRLGPCHRPAVRALRAAVEAGGVHLAQASDHGRCWGLYFAGPNGRMALLATELRLRRDHGGSHTDASGPAPSLLTLT